MKDKSSKPSAADKRAADKLRRIWDAKLAEAKLRGHGWTQETAGAAMGMTQGAVSQFLRGYAPLGYGPLLKFADFLKVIPAEIRDDLESLPQEGAQSIQGAEIDRLKTDILALRTILVALTGTIIETLPTVGAGLSETLRHPRAKLPFDQGFLDQFLQSVEKMRQAVDHQRNASSSASRKSRT